MANLCGYIVEVGEDSVTLQCKDKQTLLALLDDRSLNIKILVDDTSAFREPNDVEGPQAVNFGSVDRVWTSIRCGLRGARQVEAPANTDWSQATTVSAGKINNRKRVTARSTETTVDAAALA